MQLVPRSLLVDGGLSSAVLRTTAEEGRGVLPLRHTTRHSLVLQSQAPCSPTGDLSHAINDHPDRSSSKNTPLSLENIERRPIAERTVDLEPLSYLHAHRRILPSRTPRVSPS